MSQTRSKWLWRTRWGGRAAQARYLSIWNIDFIWSAYSHFFVILIFNIVTVRKWLPWTVKRNQKNDPEEVPNAQLLLVVMTGNGWRFLVIFVFVYMHIIFNIIYLATQNKWCRFRCQTWIGRGTTTHGPWNQCSSHLQEGEEVEASAMVKREKWVDMW